MRVGFESDVSLPELSYGYLHTITNAFGRQSYPFPLGSKTKYGSALESNPSGRRTIIRNDITTGIQTSHHHLVSAQPLAPARKVQKRTSKKDRIKSSTVAIYAGIFALLISIISVGYYAPEQTANGSPDAVANTAAALTNTTVNDVVAANIAASVASVTDLAVAGNAAELAVATEVQSLYGSADDSASLEKPAIVELSAASRNITTYTVVEGDTVASIAAQFGITEQTIRWANNLTDGEAVKEGKVLDILPRDGIVYTVESGDTVADIAEKYKASASVITTYNDLEISGLTEGLKIIIPGGELPETERPGYTAPVVTNTFLTGYSSGWGASKTWYIKSGTPNRGAYAPGNCTAYAFDRRAELGRPIGARWGNAGTWAMYAINEGYTVNRTPAAGAVIQDWGHVGIVERVLPNGDLELSEMNAYVAGGGYNIVSGRILPKSQIGQYYYIH